MKKGLLAVIFIAVASFAAQAADALYVQSLKAKVMAEKNFGSRVVTVLNRGTEVSGQKEEGGWHLVTVKGKKGWMHRLSLGETPPIEKVSIVTGNAEELEKTARRRASAVTSAAAARGLSDADRKRLSQQGVADYRSLTRLEKMTMGISENQLEDFMQEGGGK